MRMRNNKLINFLLEISQVMLVFLGVYSAIMCTAVSLELTFDRVLLFFVMLLTSILFYGLFTVLETFRKGKLYGLIGISFFFLVILLRFFGSVKKGFVAIANSFLKEFMNYTGTNLNLLSYADTDSNSIKFCMNLILILLGVYLIGLISAFFYRRRHSKVFLLSTIPFVFLPLVVGRLGRFSHFFIYLIVMITIIGTRHLKTDATDRRMRQKLAIILMIVGVFCGGITYLFVSPAKYDRNMDKLTQAKNSVISLTDWSAEDIFVWMKTYFNEDAMTYGSVGKKREISYTGEAMIKISGEVNTEHGLYLKGYVGDVYENNKWSSLEKEKAYQKDKKVLDDSGVTIENWHAQLRNELGDSETTGETDIWQTGRLRIRNLAFGYGNYLVPYLPTTSFQTENNGRMTVSNPSIDYEVEYYLEYPAYMRQDIVQNQYRMASYAFWETNKIERQNLTDFAEKYYLTTPKSLDGICQEYQEYLEKQNHLYSRYQRKLANRSEIIQATKNYITQNTQYTLAPGKTPSGKDTVEYFLKESKKGYCTYYATTAAILLRSVGIPTRYVEGMYVTKEELKEGVENGGEISVPDEDAHAWVEVYDENYGFVPLEVTPGRGEDDTLNTKNTDLNTEQNTETNAEKDTDVEPEGQQEVATPTPAVTEIPEESMVFDDIEGNEEESAETKQEKTEISVGAKVVSVAWKILLLLVLVAAVFEIQRRGRKHVFNRNMRSLKAKKRIRMAYHHLIPVFAERTVVYRGQSLEEYAKELSRVFEMPKEEMTEFVLLIFHARFGPDTIKDEQLRDFGQMYHRICNKVYRDAKWIKKLYYLYIMVL